MRTAAVAGVVALAVTSPSVETSLAAISALVALATRGVHLRRD